MDEPQGHYTQWNKSNRERQIPYDFTCMWNLKPKIFNELIDTENRFVVAKGRERWVNEMAE